MTTDSSASSADRASRAPFRVGVVGDLHMHWAEADVRWFARSGYDLLLFVGDLASWQQGKRVVAGHMHDRLQGGGQLKVT